MPLQTPTLESAILAAFAKGLPSDMKPEDREKAQAEMAKLAKDLSVAIHAFVVSGEVGGVQVTDQAGVVLQQSAPGKVA